MPFVVGPYEMLKQQCPLMTVLAAENRAQAHPQRQRVVWSSNCRTESKTSKAK